MEANENLRKSLIKISEGKHDISACNILGLGFLAAAAIAAITFISKYTKFELELVESDGFAILLLAAFTLTFSLSIFFRRQRNQAFRRLREGATEVHDAAREEMMNSINHTRQEVKL